MKVMYEVPTSTRTNEVQTDNDVFIVHLVDGLLFAVCLLPSF